MTAVERLSRRLYAALKHAKSCTCGECSGGLNAVDDLVALVVSERERADKAERERDEALQAARDGGWEMSSEEEVRHLAGMLESQNLITVEAEARAERAETALREIAESQQATSSGDIPPEDLQWEPLPGAAAQAIARAVLSGLVGDTEERQPCS